MKKLYSILFTSFLFFSAQTLSAQVLTFSFAGSAGDEATWPSSSQGAGVQPSTISRGAGVSPALTDDRFNSIGWTTSSSIDLNDYIEFTVTPVSGYSITMSSIALQSQRSTKAPRSFVIRTSMDGYAADATNVVTRNDVNTFLTSTFTFTAPITTSSPVTIRIYAYNAINSSSSWGPGQSADGNDLVVSGSFALLPVKFENVKGIQKNNSIEIAWTNATESDLLYYVVERSANAQNFTDLTTLSPEKNNGGAADYLFTDRQPLSNTSFYRIKAVETTGRVIYSNIIKIETAVNGTALNIYPNPAFKGASIAMQINNITAGNYHVKIYNTSGQLMLSQNIFSGGSSLNQSLSVGNWQKGMYVLEIEGAVTLQKQLVVQ